MDKKGSSIIDKMNEFRTSLIGFAVIRKKMLQGKKTSEEDEIFPSLFDEISVNVGKYGPIIKEITGLETIHTSAGPQDVWNWALSSLKNTIVLSALSYCVSATSRTIGTLEKDINEGLRDKETGKLIKKSDTVNAQTAQVFIVHGGKSEARDKLYRFLSALGVMPLIIEEEPKEGRSVNEQVEYYSGQASCAIILGTADDKELKDGKLYPRRNVYIEIGRFQERFPKRIVYLLEEGASFPSDISEKLYTRFTQESMDEAFITVARELREFGCLKSVKP